MVSFRTRHELAGVKELVRPRGPQPLNESVPWLGLSDHWALRLRDLHRACRRDGQSTVRLLNGEVGSQVAEVIQSLGQEDWLRMDHQTKVAALLMGKIARCEVHEILTDRH